MRSHPLGKQGVRPNQKQSARRVSHVPAAAQVTVTPSSPQIISWNLMCGTVLSACAVELRRSGQQHCLMTTRDAAAGEVGQCSVKAKALRTDHRGEDHPPQPVCKLSASNASNSSVGTRSVRCPKDQTYPVLCAGNQHIQCYTDLCSLSQSYG